MRYIKTYEALIDDLVIKNCEDILLSLSDNNSINVIIKNDHVGSFRGKSSDIVITIDGVDRKFELDDECISDIYRLIDYLDTEGIEIESISTYRPSSNLYRDLNKDKIKNILLPWQPWLKSFSGVTLRFNKR